MASPWRLATKTISRTLVLPLSTHSNTAHRNPSAIERPKTIGAWIYERTSTASRISLIVDDGYGFDFNEEFRSEQAWYVNSSACRRIFDVDVLVAHLAKFGQVGEVKEVTVQLDDIVERSAHSFKRGLEVFKHLLNLGAEVFFTDDIAGTIEGDLTGNEYNCPASYDCHLRVANGLRHRVRNQQVKIDGVRHLLSCSYGGLF